ncbi:(4Fe-4S)-binding protein [Streptomyces sp. NPDC051286]|uniref:(4Fe-4S)-binding protein n=1 Tax=Streptomyces sp. NPDC051286 TaxID=3365647 RepID=UPI003789E9B7
MNRPRRADARSYRGESIFVSYEPNSACTGVIACRDCRPEVFDTARRPWIQPTAAPTAEIEQIVRRCPSGARQYHRMDGAGDESPTRPTTISRRPEGALVIRGELAVDTTDGVRQETWAVLCGCGATRNVPCCDHNGPSRPSRSSPADSRS